jgi:hypothetical protein
MWNTAGRPELVELSKRAIHDGANGFRMTDRRDSTDRLAGVLAYELRCCPAQLHPQKFSDLDHVYPMRTTGHDQQWFATISSEDQ